MATQDRRQNDNGQGEVDNPATDGRLKENRDGGGQQQQQSSGDDVEPGGQGRVKDPRNDARLSENR